MISLQHKLLDHIMELDDEISRLNLYVAALIIAQTSDKVTVNVAQSATQMADATILGLYKYPIKFKIDFSQLDKLNISADDTNLSETNIFPIKAMRFNRK